MKNMKKIMKRAIVVTLACAMVAGTAVPTQFVKAAAKTSIVISNKRTVMVAGRKYNVKTKDAKSFQSSNAKVATISKTGVITPKKTGYVTISAIVDGKKVKTKFLSVSKRGVTSSQGKIDKMLAAPNVKKITIKSSKDNSYVIDKGNYTKKTLVINAPLSDVKNSGSFAKIVVRDVKNGTLTNYAKNKFVITDDNFKFIEKAKGSSFEVRKGSTGTLKVSGKDVTIASEGDLNLLSTDKATFGILTIKGGTFTVDASKMPGIKGIVVEGKADIKIVGKTNANIPITIKDTAEGTTLDTSCSVKLQVEAKSEIKLTDAAGGSEIKAAKDITAKISVDKSVKGTVAVGIIGSDTVKTVNAGAEVSVAKDGTITEANGAIGGGGFTPAVVSVKATYDGTNTKYEVVNAGSFNSLTSYDVKVVTATRTETVTINKALMEEVEKLIDDSDTTLKDLWKTTTNEVTKIYGSVTAVITTPDSNVPESKLVAFTAPNNTSINNKTYRVVLDDTQNLVTIQNVVSGSKVYKITKTDANNLTIDVNNGETVYTVLRNTDNTQIVVTKVGGASYTIKTDATHTYFTINGDTTKKVIISNVVQ
ncbi:MAG: hypothetical protein ACERKN_09910 [Velocimicrobium sp.]